MTVKAPSLPEQDSYSAQFSQDAIGVKLAGGAMRLRADQLGAAQTVRATWFFSPAEFAAWQSFWAFDTQRGTLPFLCDLIIDAPYPMQYMVRCVPGSYSVDQVRGLSIKVSMELEVEQNEFTIATVQFSSAGQSITIISAALTAPDMQVLFDPGDALQVAGAAVNNGVNVPLNFDAIYEVNTTPTPTIVTLLNPVTDNVSWDTPNLPTYPSGLSGNIPLVYIMRVPT